MENTVLSIPDADLLARAVQNCRARNLRKGVKHPRWTAVADTFALGSTYSQQLCRRFNLDPDAMVTR